MSVSDEGEVQSDDVTGAPEAEEESTSSPHLSGARDREALTTPQADETEALRAEIKRLKEWARTTRWKLRGWRVVSPAFSVVGWLWRADRLQAALRNLHGDLGNLAEDPTQEPTAADWARLLRQSPKRVYAVFEEWVVWHFRHRFLFGLFAAIAGGLVALIPAYVVSQQNTLIARQTTTLEEQGKSLREQVSASLAQTAAINSQERSLAAQVQVAEEQRDLLKRQNEIASLGGLHEAYYDLRHQPLMDERWASFQRLFRLGESNFSGIALKGKFKPRAPNMTTFSPSGDRIQGIYGELDTVAEIKTPRLNFAGSTFSTLVLGFVAPGQFVDFTGATLENCVLVMRDDASQTLILDRARLINCRVRGRVAGVDLRVASLIRCHVELTWNPGQGILSGTRLEGVALGNQPARGSSVKENRLDLAVLASAASLWDIRGPTREEFSKLKEQRPTLMEWWPLD